MARSISFLVDGPVDTQITIDELDDGTLRFTLRRLDTAYLGDLRAVYFDLVDLNVSDIGLVATGDLVTSFSAAEASVDRLADKDTNLKGPVTQEQGKFDVGVQFGTSGKTKDDISEAGFILSSASQGLSLDSLDLADFGLRYTSVGDEIDRDMSSKIAGDASGVARNDAWEVDENSSEIVDLLENDTNGILGDGTRKSVIAVSDALGDFVLVAGGFERTVVIDALELGTLFVSDDGFATFTANGADVDKLAHDDIRQWSFNYVSQSSLGNTASADVLLTIDGQNDSPVTYDVTGITVNEDDASSSVQSLQFGALTGDGVTVNFEGSDIDIGDKLTYVIISNPTDSFGNEYGSVINNNDGTFTFNPGDEFQFLNQGESRTVTFEYYAYDDSGVGEATTSPEESEKSNISTAEITVEGSDDAPITLEDALLFITENQSMFGTGSAIVLDDPNMIPFYGFETNSPISLNATLIPGATFSGAVMEGILGAAEAVADWVAGWFGEDVDLPDEITTPAVVTTGSLDARVGLQPYFFLNTGDVDSKVPVDVSFIMPRQVENGETFNILSGYTIDGGATFNTMSPNVKFGIDFIFDIDTDLSLGLSASTFNSATSTQLFDLDTGNIAGFEGELGEPGINLFNFSAEDNLEYDFDLGNYGTVALNFPVIDTEGTPTLSDPELLTSEGEDQVIGLEIDIDAIIAKGLNLAGIPITFGGGDSFSLNALGVNGITFEYAWDLLSVEFISSLDAIQEFELGIEELPLLVTLEDGSEITGYKLGDEISVDTPDDSLFDADTDGDADGLIDFNVAVDMDAVFSNLTYLGLDMSLFTGLLRLTGGVSSDFFGSYNISLFDDLIPSIDGNDDEFLLGYEWEITDNLPLATLFDEQFDIIGWNTETNNTDLFFDVA